LFAGVAPQAVAAEVAAWPAPRWANGHLAERPTGRVWRARFAAVRVTPPHAWRQRRLAPEVWLFAERDLGTTPRTSTIWCICRSPRR
jgi:hypothetical protein